VNQEVHVHSPGLPRTGHRCGGYCGWCTQQCSL